MTAVDVGGFQILIVAVGRAVAVLAVVFMQHSFSEGEMSDEPQV